MCGLYLKTLNLMTLPFYGWTRLRENAPLVRCLLFSGNLFNVIDSTYTWFYAFFLTWAEKVENKIKIRKTVWIVTNMNYEGLPEKVIWVKIYDNSLRFTVDFRHLFCGRVSANWMCFLPMHFFMRVTCAGEKIMHKITHK